MKSPKLILLYDVCRLCLVKHGVEDIIEKSDLVHDIYMCTGVRVTSSENLPSKICSDCAEIVTKAKKLRVLATANDKNLKSLFDDKPPQPDDLANQVEADATNVTSNISDSESSTQQTNETNNKRRRCSSKSTDCESDFNSTLKISVRNDLFDSSATVSSSTIEESQTEDKPKEADCKPTKLDSSDLVCEDCNKKFETSKKLYVHRRMHNRRYACSTDACGKKFATKGDLEKHVRTHTGERPYVCVICRKRFAQRGTLKAHRETVHTAENEVYVD